MSANNIVVIKKEGDGKFRGYHRDFDAHCEGQYEGLDFCFCLVDVNPDELDTPMLRYLGARRADPACEICKGTGYVPEKSIFEVDTIEGAIHAYHKWIEEMNDNNDGFPFYCEYGYEFEGLEPNAETIEAMNELDLTLVKDNLKFILDHIVNTTDGYEDEFLLVNCTPETIREKAGEALDLLGNSLQGTREFESVEKLLEELHKPDDTELLDFLQQELDKNEYTGKVVCRKSTTGRGWRLLETSWDGAVPCVRRAITNYMEQVKEGSEETSK